MTADGLRRRVRLAAARRRREALRTAYDRHGAAVLYLAQRLLGNRTAAEDVTQTTFVAAREAKRATATAIGTLRDGVAFAIVAGRE